jgi:hypothetical protein
VPLVPAVVFVLPVPVLVGVPLPVPLPALFVLPLSPVLFVLPPPPLVFSLPGAEDPPDPAYELAGGGGAVAATELPLTGWDATGDAAAADAT